MPELDFNIDRAEPLDFSVVPQLVFKLRVSRHDADADAAASIRHISLQCQIRIEPTHRSYDGAAKVRLSELFGPIEHWSRSLRSMLWSQVSLAVPGFDREIEVDLPALCTFDFNVASTKYFDALSDGEVPLNFLFSGTIFYTEPGGPLQVQPIAWNKEAAFRMPVAVWRKTIDRHYPNSAWLQLDKDMFDRLHDYKRQRGLATWEQALNRLLDDAAEGAAP